MQQNERSAFRVRRHEHRSTWCAVRLPFCDIGEKEIDRQRAFDEKLLNDLPAAVPGGHQSEYYDADSERYPAARSNFDRVRSEEREIDNEEHGSEANNLSPAPFPACACERRKQNRSDRHRSGYCNSVRCAQR